MLRKVLSALLAGASSAGAVDLRSTLLTNPTACIP
ncbi:hypothetical protein SAMN05444370_1294 [Rubrimonas cliftonensis]|uniref:Uncharacterized protein n=1 Tax=Rubrimonas cliftonensis TaxID=89524 RepID=A0A1H4FW86_9RHOB|nr:hypothetical protein SAMN05444370_1294 [Rubrimonas cliftonensis]